MAITKALTKMTDCTFRAKKVEGHDPLIFFRHCAGSVPPPHFRVEPVPPLSNSFRRHCLYSTLIAFVNDCLGFLGFFRWEIWVFPTSPTHWLFCGGFVVVEASWVVETGASERHSGRREGAGDSALSAHRFRQHATTEASAGGGCHRCYNPVEPGRLRRRRRFAAFFQETADRAASSGTDVARSGKRSLHRRKVRVMRDVRLCVLTQNFFHSFYFVEAAVITYKIK